MAGFAGIEMGAKFPKVAKELGPLLDRYDLDLVSGWYDGRIRDLEVEAEWDSITPHLTLLRDMGCKHVVYADTSGRSEGDLFAPISRRPKLSDGDWVGYSKKLTLLAERMADFGVGMAFHHHMGTIVENDQEVDLLMALTGPAVGLLFDSGHCVFSGGDSYCITAETCRPGRARPLQGHPQGHDGSRQSNRRKVLCKPFSTAFLRFRATASSIFPLFLPSLTKPAIKVGSSAKRNKTQKWLTPLTYAKMGFCNLVRMALRAGFTVAP